jgi:RNA polymerase sigma-70 factor (ECF subfamily)
MGEESIIIQLKEGDEKSFEKVYRTYYKGLCAFASQYLKDPDDCEEIVQDVMMWLWENRSSLVPEMPVKSLLFTMVKNKCLNQIHHLQIKQRVHNELYANIEEPFEDPDTYSNGEMLEILNKSINNLPDDYRIAFTMNRFENYTYSEIADKMNVSTKTIAYRISQALKILRIDLKDYIPGN